MQFLKAILILFNKRASCKSHLACHSEGAERPENLLITRKYEILRSAQDDKMVVRRGLNLEFKIANP
jgi:hypothetical protein